MWKDLASAVPGMRTAPGFTTPFAAELHSRNRRSTEQAGNSSHLA